MRDYEFARNAGESNALDMNALHSNLTLGPDCKSPTLSSHDSTRPEVVVFNQLASSAKYSKYNHLNYLAFGMVRA